MNDSLKHSLLIHGTIIGFFFFLMYLDQKEILEKFEFQIIEKEIVNIDKKPKIIINGADRAPIKEVESKKPREVFGVKRKTLTDKKGKIDIKVGNTLTKKEDDKVLRDDEADSLPKPAEEFLITTMPRPIKEIRPNYPLWAKKKKITGSVIFEILIDKKGDVRKANLLKGLHPKLDILAQKAIMKFKFKPAFIDKEPTAVKIKYAIKFILES